MTKATSMPEHSPGNLGVLTLANGDSARAWKKMIYAVLSITALKMDWQKSLLDPQLAEFVLCSSYNRIGQWIWINDNNSPTNEK